MRLAFLALTFVATLVACGAPATLTEQQPRAIAAERGIAVPIATVQADSVRADSLSADEVRRLVAAETRAGEERAVERARVATGSAPSSQTVPRDLPVNLTRWRLIRGGAGSAGPYIYLDTRTARRTGSTTDAWTWWAEEEVNPGNDFVPPFDRVLNHNIYDCSARTNRYVEVVRFRAGVIADTWQFSSGFNSLTDIVPGSYGEVVFDAVCAWRPSPGGSRR